MTTIAATIVPSLDGAETDGTGFAVATLAEVALGARRHLGRGQHPPPGSSSPTPRASAPPLGA